MPIDRLVDAAPGPVVPPRLSVVIAAFNAEPLLGGQLRALAAQPCPVPWELLICDNGSTDGTRALAERWAGRLPVRVIDASAVPGPGPARNAGVRAARGGWVAFCDADDEVGPGWLAAVCAALAEHEVVAGAFDDTKLNPASARRSRPNDQRAGLQYLTPGIGLPHGGAGNLAIHRSVFLEVGGFDPQLRYLEDTDLCWRLQLVGHRLAFAADMLVHVRLRPDLRTMYRQGRNFGAAQAALEARYADLWRRPGQPAAPRPAVPGLPSPAAATLSLVQHAARLIEWSVTNRTGLGGQVWQLGWHAGHRRRYAG